MPVRKPRTPSYRHNKTTNRAVVTIAGRDYWLGRYNSTESRAEYDRLIAEWLAGGRAIPPTPSARPSGPARDLTISELVLAYWRFAEGYYRKGGRPTSEVVNIKLSLKPLHRAYGHTPARDFSPLALKTVRQEFIESGICRNEVNRRARHVVRMFKWAVENGLVPPDVHHGLKAVSGLRQGRTEARETEPVAPVPDEHVDVIRPHVSRQVWTMVELQRLTGMRPGEAVTMKTGELDRSGPVWAYTPSSHKTEHHGRKRLVLIGPRAQDVLTPWLRADPDAFLFSPAEAMTELRAAQRAARKSPVQPSQRSRAKAKPDRKPGDRYTVSSYDHAIARACRKVGVPPWGANRLRHSAGTEIRRRFGLEAAQVILGHAKADVTQVYAEADAEAAAEIMRKIG